MTDREKLRGWLALATVFLLSAFVYWMGGSEGRLNHDDAIFLYGGQSIARGTPVYVGVFDHKGPLGQMVCAVGVTLADMLGRDGIATTRWLFLGIASATATGVFALSRRLFGSNIQALVTAACFVSFWGFGAHAFSGTRPKMLMTMFEVFALLFLARRNWFLTGFTGTLAAFTWQPTGLFVIAAFAIAALREGSNRDRFRAARRVALGGLVPTVVLLSHAAMNGALGEFLDGCFVFNLAYLENPSSLRRQIASMMTILVYNGMGIPTLFGLLGIGMLYAWRIRESGWRRLVRDPFACLLFTFPLPVAWSLLDFQQYPDFFVFLPYVALSLGWLLSCGARGVADALELSGRRRKLLLVAPALVLAVFSAATYRFARNRGLIEQRAQARHFERVYGDATIAAIGVPEAPVLLDRENIARYSFIMRGIRDYIQAKESGGFAGWLRAIDAARPDVVIVDETYPERLGTFAGDWKSWLERYERAEPIGDWSIFVKR